MPRELDHVGAVGLEGMVYAIGGFVNQNRGAVADAYAYDPATDTWSEIAPLPNPRGALAVTQLDGRIHAIGGRDSRDVNTHEVYDPATDAWNELAPIPTAREHMGAAVVGGKIYVPGGRFETFQNNTGVHEAYDPVTDEWQTLAPLPTPRSGIATTTLDGRVLVFGDEEGAGVVEENEAYDPEADS